MRPTSLPASLFLASLLCSTGVQVLPVRLTLSPSRSQFFKDESVTLTCEDGNISAGWTVRRNTSKGTRKPCGDGWWRKNGSICKTSSISEHDSGVYWCESGSSSISSSSIQLSVSGGSVILQSPVLPVMEGHDVTLRCHDQTFSNLPAAFYKDGSFIGDGPSGHMTLHVSSSDEGHYKCSISGQGESPSSWIWVKGRISSTPPPSSTSIPPSISPPDLQNLHCLIFLSAVVSLLFLVLLVSFFYPDHKETETDQRRQETDNRDKSAAETSSCAPYWSNLQ